MAGSKEWLEVRLRNLEAENVVLRSDNRMLRTKLGAGTWRVDGFKAEQYVQQLIGGRIEGGSAPADLKLPSGITSKLNSRILTRQCLEKSPSAGIGRIYLERIARRSLTGCS